MAAITYPTALPDPQSLTLRDAERRALQGMDSNAPASTRALERDYRGTATVAHVFTAEQFAAWSVWRELALTQGGAWFYAARWPCPWGRGCTARYAGPATVDHLGRGLRRVEAEIEVRGATEAPARPAPVEPLSVVELAEADLLTHGAELTQMPRLITSVDDVWHYLPEAGAGLTLLGSALLAGAPINPTRGSLPCGAVQFRGAADTSGSLGRLGVVINGDNNTAAAARLQAGLADRVSLITGSSTAGHAALLPWDSAIELVHIGQLSMAGTYTVQDSGTVSAASVEFLRLTFSESDNIVALLFEEYPPTNYAGTPGTGSARLVRVRGIPAAGA